MARTWVLPATPDSPRKARQQARAWLRESRYCQLADDAVLITSELATNAIRHGAGPVWHTLKVIHHECGADVIRIEVGDHGPGWDGPRTPRPAAPDDCHGRGLRLVEALSSQWGAHRIPHGHLVWVELATAPDNC